MNLNQANIVELSALTTSTTTRTSTGVDVSAYNGPAQVILMSEAGGGTTPTLDVKLQDCATVGGTYADVTGAVFSQVTDAADACQMIAIKPGELKKFIRVVGTLAGTSPTYEFGVAMVGILQAGRNSSQDV